jgi:GNAT superfamily N-acetyltransferase
VIGRAPEEREIRWRAVRRAAMLSAMLIREATEDDWPAIWPFLHRIVAAGETFTYDPDLAEDDARGIWLLSPPGRTVVALAIDGTVLGTAKMNPNQMGPGSHVCSASFMVDPEHSGRGVGRALVEHALEWARLEGYRAMQFNAVAESNARAVALYRSLGFEILGTVPEGFKHPVKGYVGLHIMHRRL